MESRSPSNGIRSSMYSSILIKEAKTPCSLSLCSHNKLRRGTNRMWKSLDECILSSLKSQQSRIIRHFVVAKNCKIIAVVKNAAVKFNTCRHSEQWCPWAPASDGQRRWCFWRQQRGACHFWGWTFFPLHVPWKKKSLVETLGSSWHLNTNYILNALLWRTQFEYRASLLHSYATV